MKKILSSAVAIFVILVVVLIIIPLPTGLIDFAIVINIALSLTILLMSMLIKNVLDFSVFPSILLITTLFRLGLNISTTRQILGNAGDAGKVVKTFGEFVIQGNAAVGFIIFIIIVIVQFLVITKGAERVSEVSARFTLDAMPGKQMAIDADLNTGLIDEQEAKRRRADVQREADFFGAMDGASKFVKGDSIMSIVTAFINLIGGVIMGMVMEGMDFGTCISTYTIATIGDGLCSQLPALFISTAMGMIVTRTASETDLNTDVIGQFSRQPVAIMIAGGVIICLMVIPGFPKPQLFITGAGLIALGFALNRTLNGKSAEEEAAEKEKQAQEALSETEYYKDIDNVYKLLSVEPIEMEFGYSLIPLADESAGGTFIERVVIFRKQFAQEMGMVFPSVRMRDNQNINPNKYVIKIKGEAVADGEILIDHYLALDNGSVSQEIDGIDTIEPAFHMP